jgi:hypothetical protein
VAGAVRPQGVAGAGEVLYAAGMPRPTRRLRTDLTAAPCPDGLLRSWDPPHPCVAPTPARRSLTAVFAVSAVGVLLGLLLAGALLPPGAHL